MNPPPGTIVAKLPYPAWLDFRWNLLLALLSVYNESNAEAAIAASKILSEAESKITVEWADANPDNRSAVLPFAVWNEFRWEIALNVISIISKESLEAGRAAVQILADAAKLVVSEFRPG